VGLETQGRIKRGDQEDTWELNKEGTE